MGVALDFKGLTKFQKNGETEYLVKAGNRSGSFPNRRLARQYKKLLAEINVEAEILKIEYDHGFLRSETKVS